MRDVADIETKSLGYQEVESLLRASRATVYSKTNQIPEKKTGSFEKRSMVEIARVFAAASSSSQSVPPSDMPAEGLDDPAFTQMPEQPFLADTEAEHVPSDGKLSPYAQAKALQDASTSSPGMSSDEVVPKNALDAAETQSADDFEAQAEHEATNDKVLAAEQSDRQLDAGAELETPEAVFMPTDLAVTAAENELESDIAEIPVVETEINTEAYDEAFAAGRLAMQAEMQAELGSAFAALTNLIDGFTSSDAEAYSDLYAMLEKKVIDLASERAGYAIEENPDKFAEKISRLVHAIGDASRGLKIMLNPQDLAAVKNNLSPYNLQIEHFVGDANLASGDVRIVSGAIEIKDVMQERVSNPAVKDKESLASIGRVINEFLADASADASTDEVDENAMVSEELILSEEIEQNTDPDAITSDPESGAEE